MFLILLTEMLFASTWTIGKAALAYLNPIFFIGLRMTLAGTILLSYLYFFKRDKFFLHKKDWLLFLQIIIFHIYIAYVFEFWALKYLSSFKTAFFYNLTPFISALFGYIFLSERMSLKKWLGMAIGFTGIIWVMVSGQTAQEASAGKLFFLSWPEISLITAVASAVYGWVVFKKLNTGRGYSSLMINGFGMLSGGLLSFISSFFLENSCCTNGQSLFSMPATDILLALGYTLLLIVVANLIGYNLYGYLLTKYSITFLSFAGTLTPFFAAFFGAVFLGEIPSISFFLSSILVVIGLYIFYMQEMRVLAKKS